MKLGVIGYGHFAGVVTGCLMNSDHVPWRWDEEPHLLRAGQSIVEPGLDELFRTHEDDFVTVEAHPERYLDDAALLWIAYDVPLDAAGAPVVDDIIARIQRLDAALPKSIPFLVSCQWPVGTTRKIAAQCEGREFVYVMENVRVGKAIADFQANPLPAIGAADIPQGVVWDFIKSIQTKDAWCGSWESIELAKHTTNAFMALQIAFINEIGRIADAVGAEKADVSRALMSDARVSPHAPLKPGGPFGGGSLKRDLLVLEQVGEDHKLVTPIIDSILMSNEA